MNVARVRLRHVDRAGCVSPADFEHGGVKGRSALDAAWNASLEGEIGGNSSGKGSGTILLDLSKCYERVPLEALGKAAVAEGWPGRVVAMALGQYSSVRFVSVAGATVPAGNATCGMIPGCALAVRFLGSYLKAPIKRAIRRAARGRARIRTYVDDLRISVEGTPEEVAEILTAFLLALKEELEQLGIRLELPKCCALGATHNTEKPLRQP